MRIAYLLSWDLSSQDGVTKKVFNQTEQWLKYGHEVMIFCISKNSYHNTNDVPVCLVKREAGKNIIKEYISIGKAFSKIYTNLEEFNPDVIYHRSEIYHHNLKPILSRFPTVIEINSNDLSELKEIGKKGLKGKIRYFYYKAIRNKYLSNAAGFCCVTNEIASLQSFTKFKIPIDVVPNTIKLDKYSPLESTNSTSIPSLIFMGSPNQDWHGVDKIIELAKETDGQLQFEIIGPEKPSIEIPSNINFHGFLNRTEYEKILQSSDIGICSIALHRNNMDEACPLKTREYLAFGLPIILGYKDTCFNEDLPDWVLQLENKEENILKNIDQILKFSKKYKGLRLTKEQVARYIDTATVERKRIKFLESLIRN